jgi:hypothetical protein
MRVALLIFGILIFALASLPLLPLVNTINEYKNQERTETLVPNERTVTYEQYRRALRISMFCGVTSIMGLIVVFIGAAIPKKSVDLEKTDDLQESIEGKPEEDNEKIKLPEKSVGTRYCPKCAQKCETEDLFCRFCGAKIASGAPQKKRIRDIYVFINTEYGKEELVRKELNRLDGAIRADTLIGPYDNVVILEGWSIGGLTELVEQKVKKISGVKEAKILVVL